ncbi:DUF5058 family protein [Guggenheimella bovis]
MKFSVNHLVLFIISGIIILFVIAQSVFFLKKAWVRAKELGIETNKLKNVVKSSIAFTIAPAVSIVLGLISLAKFLGLPLPWLRLSVLGALTYELPAAASVSTIMKLPLDQTVTDPRAYTTIAWVMTLGILSGILVILFFQKKMQSSLQNLNKKSAAWNQILMDALFIGMIAAFLGMVFGDITQGLKGWIPVFVLIFSSVMMIILGLLSKKFKWLENYALPISMVCAMAFSIPLTAWIGA